MIAALLNAQEQAAPAADGHSEVFDLGELLAHHILNSREIEYPGGVIELPHFEPVQIAGLLIDFSPTKHLVLMLFSALLTLVLCVWASRAVARNYVTAAPSGVANAVEAVVVFFRDEVCKPNIGHGYRAFTPFILTLFFFILTMNLMGLIPYGGSATGSLSVTAGLALITFVVTEVSGFMKQGFVAYMKTIFFVPEGIKGVGAIALLFVMAPVEFLGKLTKPFALCIRLFANMTAGHMLIFSLLGLIFVFGQVEFWRGVVTVGSFGMTSAIMMLELLVAFIQAYIFAMLSAVFIGLMQHAH